MLILLRDAFLYDLTALLVIIDPPGTAAIFAAMTARDSTAEKREQANRAVLVAFLVLGGFGLLGARLLGGLGIGLPALRISGGILLFLTAADMVTGSGATRGSSAGEREAAIRTDEDISVFPLAIPLIAGPGAMTTMVLLRSEAARDPIKIAALFAGLVVSIGATYAAQLAAPHVAPRLGHTGSNVIGRVLGVLLAALAAQIILDGLHETFPGL